MAQFDAKGALRSRGVWGAVITMVVAVASAGFHLTTKQGDSLQSTLTEVVTFAGGAVALYGRLAATTRLLGLFGAPTQAAQGDAPPATKPSVQKEK
jgi:hypothetical protein